MTDWLAAYEGHGSQIRAYLGRRLRRIEDAEDLTQEVFARAMMAPGGISDQSKTKSYLMQTAHNLLVNHLRRAPRLAVAASDLNEELDLDSLPDRRGESTDAGVQHRELIERLERCLEALPTDQRTAFELGVLRKMPYAEIAALHGWSISKVKIDVFRARKHVLGSLQPESGRS